MPVIFDTNTPLNPIFINLLNFEVGDIPYDAIPIENRLGSIIVTQQLTSTVVQVLGKSLVVLAINDGGVEPNLEPKILISWGDLMRQDYSKAFQQLEFIPEE